MTPMTTQLTEDGQKLADALVKAGAMMPEDLTYPEQLASLNTAAQILLTPDGGGSLREGERLTNADRLRIAACYHREKLPAGLADELLALADEWSDEVDTLTALTPKTSVPGNDAGMREALEKSISELDDIANAADPFDDAAGTQDHALLVQIEKRVGALADRLRAGISQPTGSAGDDETGVREAVEFPEKIDWLRYGAITEMADAAFAVDGTAPSDVQMDRLHTAAEKMLDIRVSASLTLAPQPPKAETPAGVGEDARLWDALHEAMICAWNLLDGTQNDASGVDQADWDALSASMTAVGALVPASEQPFSPSYAVPYLRALTAAPAARAGDGVSCEAVEAASAAFYDTMIGSEREFWPHHEGWAGKGKAFKAKVRGRMRTALEAALSLAPAARAGDGVDCPHCGMAGDLVKANNCGHPGDGCPLYDAALTAAPAASGEGA